MTDANSRRATRDGPDGRLCSWCLRRLPRSDFYARPDRPSKLQAYCKPCLLPAQKRRWNRRKVQVVRELGGRCADCGGTFHPACYDFHHRDPREKAFNWTKLRLLRWSAVRRELDKCDLLCANCHRLRHIDPRLWERPPAGVGPPTLFPG